MKQGTVIEYLDGGDIALGVVTGVESVASGSKTRDVYRAITDRKRVVNVPASKVVFSGGPDLKNADQDFAAAELCRLRDARKALAAGLPFGELWELLIGEGKRAWTPREIALAYFGEHASSDEISAVTRRLYERNCYFRKKDEYFYALEPDESESIRESVEREARKHAEDEAFAEAVAGIFARRFSEDEKRNVMERFRDRIQCLTGYVIDPDDTRFSSKAKAIVSKVGESTGRRFDPFRFLVALGALAEDENFLALKYEARREFSGKSLAEARRLEETPFTADAFKLVSPEGLLENLSSGAVPVFAAGERADLRGFPTLTIDGERTVCRDDAVSCAAAGGGFFLMVHIIDSSVFVPGGSELDREAMARGTSIYLCEGKIDMLPNETASRAMSLVENEDRPALSLLVECGDDAGEIRHAFVPSVIRVGMKCSYPEVNAALASAGIEDRPPLSASDPAAGVSVGVADASVGAADASVGAADAICDYFSRGNLVRLYEMCRLFEKKRIGRGAMGLNFPRADVHVERPAGSPAQVTVSCGGNGISGSMVSELMILYNSFAAAALNAAGAAAPFRVSAPYPAPELLAAFREKALSGIYDAPLAWNIRKNMPFTGGSFEMAPNGLLGTDGYVQATSPARRYMDMVVQRQLFSVCVAGAARLGPEDVKRIGVECDRALSAASEIEQESYFYWLHKYMAMNSGSVLKGCVIDATDDRFRIELEGFGLHLTAFKRAWGERAVGEKLNVRIDAAEPRDRRISFSLV